MKSAALDDFQDDEESADPITHQEVLELARVIMETEGESYADAVYSAQELLAEVGWSQGKALLNLTTGFDVVPTATLRRLRDSAQKYESKLKAMDEDVLRSILDQAFTEGASVPQVRDMIRMSFAAGVHFIDDAGNAVRTINTKSWATAVARTELATASASGMNDLYTEAGVKRIQWVAANSPTTCDDCSDADGEIVDIGDEFPSVEVTQNPAHINCVCTTSPSDDDLGSFRGTDEQQDRAARGGYSASEYSSHFGFEHPMDARREGGAPSGNEDY